MHSDGIRQRDVLMRSIRAFFHSRNYVEVETPIRIDTPCLELHIDAEESGDRFLRTSPEIFHKQLLAGGMERIFEIGKCFRKGENGPIHHPEYTMLEWYRSHSDYMDVLEETKLLIKHVAPNRHDFDDWHILTVSDAFVRFAGWDPIEKYDEDRFDIDLVETVEPGIKALGGATVLKDYPIEAAALSRRKPSNPNVAERWELYLHGVEIANAYSELVDPEEQRERFDECAEKRQSMGKAIYPVDERIIDALVRMPPAGGVALGVDRLLMVLSGESSLDPFLPFR